MEIEKGIPLPKKIARVSDYPFVALAKGESFFVEGVLLETLRTYAYRSAKAHGGKFIARKAEKDGISGVRVWRSE